VIARIVGLIAFLALIWSAEALLAVEAMRGMP
jgi:hypothetical protein